MTSYFLPPQPAPRKQYNPSGRRSRGTSTTTSRSAHPTLTTSVSRKRARQESPAREWQDLGSSYGSLCSGGAPSPGFFGPDDGSLTTSTAGMGSQPFFPSSLIANIPPTPDFASPAFASPSALAHSRYQLAGGQATPSMTESAASDFFSQSHGQEGEQTSDLGFRRGRPYYDRKSGSRSTVSGLYSSEDRLPTALLRECNGRARALPSIADSQQSSLRQSVLTSVTGIVGRVLDFCTAGTFRGFFAGGGTSYTMQVSQSNDNIEPQPSTVAGSVWQDMNSSAHMPGGFPESEFIADYWASSPAQPVKRPKHAHVHSATCAGSNSLTQSWIMVRDQESTTSPTRRKVPSAASSNASPAMMRQTPPSRPSLHRTSVSSATRAHAAPASRPAPPTRNASVAGLRSPARSPAHSRQSSQVNITPKKRASVAFAGNVEESREPLAAETARYLKDMRKQERREDRDLHRMNCALEDMIREAQEALGTTVEVEMLGEGREVDRW